MKKITLSISGMHCTSCAMNIDFDLEDVPGIHKSETSYAKSKTTVEYDPEKIDLEKIIASIKGSGYEASVDK